MTHPPSNPLDPLGEALHHLRLTGALYCRAEFSAPWAIKVPAGDGCGAFHVVTEGQCVLELRSGRAHVLQQGDFVLMPHGEGHRLMDEPSSRSARIGTSRFERITERYAELSQHGGGAVARLVCGVVHFDHPTARHLVGLLPRLIRVPAVASAQMASLDAMLRFMSAEARERRPGGDTVISRLADILVIQAIRFWIEHDPAAQTGWLGALHDPHIGRAIGLIHRAPDRAWTLSSLASAVHMSRSAFAARFTELVGEPAMKYVARWRMLVALQWLKDGATADGAGLAEMASRLGYQSEAAFSRAFKRVTGSSPGSVRRRSAVSASSASWM